MKKINTGSSDFSDLRKENVIYVDKTAYMHRLASDEENKVVFMSRPRRFGKSLTVSAFKALFTGRRELFKGLAIERLGWKWQTHPVIHFRFSEASTDSIERESRSISVRPNSAAVSELFKIRFWNANST